MKDISKYTTLNENNFENDPDFKKVAELRDRAAIQVTINAKSVYGSYSVGVLRVE